MPVYRAPVIIIDEVRSELNPATGEYDLQSYAYTGPCTFDGVTRTEAPPAFKSKIKNYDLDALTCEVHTDVVLDPLPAGWEVI